MIKIRSAAKNDCRIRKNIAQIYVRSITLTIAVFLLTATIVLGPTSTLQQQQQQVLAQEPSEPGSVLKLSRANVPIDIPLLKGYENGNEIYFIATDVSDEKTASVVTNMTGFEVNHAPILAQTPETARAQTYAFTNGIAGDGPFGFQVPVVNGKPGDEGYSPLQQINLVAWNDDATPRELTSIEEITAAEQSGELSINQTDIIANQQAIQWQNGSLMVREDANSINDDTPYMGGQVLNIDTENMIVTMVAHRGWGPDGKTIYYIVTDATPEMPANMMGVSHVPLEEQLIGTPVAPGLLQFTSGINGSGPMGFQAGIGESAPGDQNYSPMWFISFIEWNDPSQARVLETVSDIAAMQQAGLITVTPAMEGKHVVNCPFFDADTVFEHKSQQFGQQVV
ncbi:MAG TPA: hypothetical protein VE378_06575 [Nitrososphaeraceae archaeon]|jgi:hypothetical protein|nr:hypothetical protein [Nitrososphaeraceae archaeon]HZB74393.1 hypothetical protein [Nitrososphaeraceae archaeon]